MLEAETTAWQWWQSQRRKYNQGLVIAGIAAFLCYAAAIEYSMQLKPNPEVEITLFTTAFQGVGYLFAMGIANICYCLGPLGEALLRPRDVGRYRHIVFNLGFWFSVALPFSIPLLVLLGTILR